MLNGSAFTKTSLFQFFSSLIIPLVLAGFFSAVAYKLFFYCAPFIWSCNITLPIHEYTPAIRPFIEEPRNGIQPYVLFVLDYLILATTCLFYAFLNKFSFSWAKRVLLFSFAAVSFLFFARVGFTPPMSAHSGFLFGDIPSGFFILSVLAITIALSFLINKPFVLAMVLALLLFPICMIASQPYSPADYNYVLLPAMRILHGFALNQTGFQYDHLLSLLAVLWMKLGFSIYSVHYLGRVIVFAFLLVAYLFGQRYFLHKCYGLYYLISAALLMIYANHVDVLYAFGPFRFDWWIVILMAVYYKGVSHWMVGMALGFLLMFHHALGVIYAISYALFALVLLGMDVTSKRDSLINILKSYLALYAKNMVLICFSFLLYHLFFSFGQQATSVFRQHGIGFIPISRQSFYWYVPVLLSLVLILIWRNKAFLAERYFRTGLFLIHLAIGNSLYFFGRSHEACIIALSSVLLFCLFILFDLVQLECERCFSSRFSRWVLPVLAVVFIVGISFAYSGRASKRIRQQIEHVRSHFSSGREMEFMFRKNAEIFGKVTHSSKKVMFVSRYDSYYYYESGIVPQNAYVPNDPRLFMKDIVGILQAQLNKGYYLIMPAKPDEEWLQFFEVMRSLSARYYRIFQDWLILSNSEIT